MGIYSDILLTVDFDRTLTAPDSTIPQRNLDAIRYFMENGGSFTVNTGRSVPMSAHNLIPVVPVNAPLLLYNGSAAYDVTTRQFTRYTPIEVDPKQILEDIQTRFPMMNVEVQAVDAHYLIRPDRGWEAYSINNHCAYGYLSAEKIPVPFLKFAVNGQFREPTVASMYEATQEEKEQFDEMIRYVMGRYGAHLEVFRSCTRIVDFHAKGVSKLRSARLLQKELEKKWLVCVGDAENDVTMLDGADYAYCPADGTVAHRYENVCPCAEGAVADVIYEKIPAELAKQP